MANNPLVYDAATIAMINAFTALLNGGTLQVYSGSQPATDGALTGVLLVSMAFGNPAFATATASGSGGQAVANPVGNGTAVATGLAGYAALVTSGSATAGTMSVGTSGADLNFTNLGIVSGVVVACTSFIITQAQT